MAHPIPPTETTTTTTTSSSSSTAAISAIDAQSSPLAALRAQAQHAYQSALEEAAAEAAASAQLEAWKKEKAAHARQRTPTPTPTPTLRPVHDLLHRLSWDPAYEVGDYAVVYLDRFAGQMERPLVEWRRETTDEEFIPLHRVVGVKDCRTGAWVWDKKRRVDEVFGSGKGRNDGEDGA